MRLAREIRRAGCSAILCQEYESPRFDASVVIGKLLRIPVFAAYQGGNYQRSGIERFVRPLTLRGSAGLIIGSSFERARVRERYGTSSENIARIFNPLDLAQWQSYPREDARRALGISAAARVAIWHGRVDIRTKGLDVLLEAWNTICSQRPAQDLLLMLVGTGSDAEALNKEIRRLAVPGVHWINEYVLDRDAMRQYLSAADIYVFPSRREGFPVAPLEAMACSLPVVAASAPGVADIFEAGEDDGGIVVPVGDAPSLAHAIGRLVDNPTEARALGAKARIRVERAFSLENVGAELLALLRLKNAVRGVS